MASQPALETTRWSPTATVLELINGEMEEMLNVKAFNMVGQGHGSMSIADHTGTFSTETTCDIQAGTSSMSWSGLKSEHVTRRRVEDGLFGPGIEVDFKKKTATVRWRPDVEVQFTASHRGSGKPPTSVIQKTKMDVFSDMRLAAPFSDAIEIPLK